MRKCINSSERQRGKSEISDQIKDEHISTIKLSMSYTPDEIEDKVYMKSIGGQLCLTLIKLDIVDKYDFQFIYGFKERIPFVYTTTIKSN
jgi:hypothetical protein